jgi:sugar/nucleoside kinase (ribokinase family)
MVKPMRIAILGNINLDIKTAPIAAEESLLRDGETSVEEIYESIGGGGALTAVAAARMGSAVSFCGAIGEDPLGHRLQSALQKHSVKPHLITKPAATGKSIALNLANGHRHFLSYLPSEALLEAMDVNLDALCGDGCVHLYRADIWFAPLMLAEGNLQIFQAARQHGIKNSIDINWDPFWSAGRNDSTVKQRIEAVRRLLPLVDYVHGNQRELCFFAGCDNLPSAVKWLISQDATHLIVHRGGEGSVAISLDGNWIESPSVKLGRPVRPGGAGDVFTAAFLSSDVSDLKAKLAVANRAAAEHCSGRTDYFPRL